jgi:hypothetical protein
MKRRLAPMVLIAAVAFTAGCSTAPPDAVGHFVHVVLFKLKVGAQTAVTQKFLDDARDMLPGIPGVRGLWVGRPVPMSPSSAAVNDTDYDVGFVLLFEDSQGLNDYRNHPKHDESSRCGRSTSAHSAAVLCHSPRSPFKVEEWMPPRLG